MKPFNLEEALAGKPVVTRDGRSVKITGYNEEARDDFQIAGWLEGIVRGWGKDGRYTPNGGPDDYDLFMTPEKTEGWVNIFRTTVPTLMYPRTSTSMGIYDTKEEAIASMKEGFSRRGYITTIKIQWEE